MKIYIQRDGTELGPYSSDDVRTLLNDGLVLPSDLARIDGTGQWTVLESIPGITTVNSSPSQPPPVTFPRTSKLAVWSLVLGLLGIVTLGILSIPSIFCGHLAHARIRKSAGTLTGRGLAIAGFVLGYVGLLFLILAVAGFLAGNGAINKARKVTALTHMIAIESAVTSYYTEYGEMPSKAVITDTAKDTSLAKCLSGDDKVRNVRGVRFLVIKDARANKNGLDPATFRIFDPWGNGYQVILDTEYKKEIIVTRGGITETVKGHRAAVYSPGKDGIPGTADDVKSW